MRPAFDRLAIVDRGEGAMRVLHTVRELDEQRGGRVCLIAIHSDADRQAMAVRQADEAISLGPVRPGPLDLEAVEAALIAAHADAAWAGWDAVASRPAFAEMCERLGIVFIGPDPATLRLTTDKIAAHRVAEEAGAAVPPWSGGPVASAEEAARHAVEIGFPLMVKAAAGSGGLGVRRVDAPDQLPSAFESARAEAEEAFGDTTVFLETAVDHVRRLAVQILADGRGATWAVGVRDATCGRHGHRILEESACPALSADQEHDLRDAAVRISDAAGFRGAGTIEFLWDADHRRPWFLKIVPHLQPGHPATEMTTGLDLVKAQLRVAIGGRLEGAPPVPAGHALAARLRIEDHGPSDAPAGLQLLRLPNGPFVRVDTGVTESDTLIPGADTTLATVVAWGADRGEAIGRLRHALSETLVVVDGAATNQGALLELLDRPELRAGTIDTAWLEQLDLSGGLAPDRHADVALVQAAIESADAATAVDRGRFYAFARRGRPEADAPIVRKLELRYRGERYSFSVSQLGPTRWRVAVDGVVLEVDVERRGPHEQYLTLGGSRHRTLLSSQGADILVAVDGVPHRIAHDEGGIVRNTAPAVVVSIPVAVGDEVAAGDVVAVVESMKMESSYVAPFAGRVRAVLTTPNVQVGPQAPLVQLEPLAEIEPDRDAERVVFSVVEPVRHPLLRRREALWRLEWLALGYDFPPAEATRIVAAFDDAATQYPEPADGEAHLIELYSDLQALTRPRHDDDEGQQRSPQEHLHAWLHSLDAVAEGLPAGFRVLLERALAHYDVDGLERTPALEDAAYRLFVAEQRSAAARAAVLAMIDGCAARYVPGATGPGRPFRRALDRLVQVTGRRDPVLADIARECRWRFFDEPLVEEARERIYAEASGHLDQLMAAPDGPGREASIAAAVACPRALVTTITERLRDADPTQRRALLEVMTRRFYRMPSLAGFGEVDGLLTATYRYQGRARNLLTAAIDLDGLDDAVRRFAALAADVPEGREVSADFYAERRGAAPPADETAAALTAALRAVDLPPTVHRVVVAIAVPERGRGLGAVELFTFRPGPEGLAEDELVRGLHPMIAERLQLWRLQNFTLERLPAAEDVYLFHGVARENPKDERLFAMAEVRDLTPVRDDDGRVTALPEFERVYVEALEGLRHFQAHLRQNRRLQWNRVLLHVWPEIELRPDELARIVARLAPNTDGLGIEMVLVRGRMREDDATVRDRVVRLFSPAGTGIVTEVDEPPTEPLQPLDEGARRVVSARRRGTPHPAEVLKLLGGSFEEHDLDASGALVPIDRPIAMNEAGIVAGLVRNVTPRHPEGMLRVALLGDPTKALGSLAEPECRLINAALDLAERLGVPLEWFAISAGARIAMDSGTENMDWISAVLRRIIEFTQRGGELNVVVTGINVGAQPYWNAEATMLMHTRGILVMTPESAMVLTGKQALDYSGGVSADDNLGIGGYERIMGPNGQGQYWAPDLAGACAVLLRYYDHGYVVPGERFPRRATTRDPADRDVRPAPHAAPDSDLKTVGAIFSAETNPERKKPFDIRAVMRAAIDADEPPLERWAGMRDAESGVVWDAHLGGMPVALLGLESRPLPRYGEVPADGPERWTSGTLFPRSSKKIARAINSVAGRRPLVVLANLSGFDGSPESMRAWQLEFGAEIGRAVVNFDGPIVFCVVARYHGGAFVVFSHKLNDNFEAVALEGARASVIGGAPAAAVVFARDVDIAAREDPRIAELDARLATAEGSERQRLRVAREARWAEVRSEKLGELAARFDAIHSIERAVEVGSVHRIIEPAALRPYLIDAVERGMARAIEQEASRDGSRVSGPVGG
ncbi:MAG TPA: carboxyl transferase domain-containing protein [Solirubrobacteraceae bacterium]